MGSCPVVMGVVGCLLDGPRKLDRLWERGREQWGGGADGAKAGDGLRDIGGGRDGAIDAVEGTCLFASASVVWPAFMGPRDVTVIAALWGFAEGREECVFWGGGVRVV